MANPNSKHILDYLVLMNGGIHTIVALQSTTLKRLRRLEKRMAEQEVALQGVVATLARVQEGVDRLQDALAAALEDNPALADEIAAIVAAANALDADVNPVEPTPEPEPAPEG